MNKKQVNWMTMGTVIVSVLAVIFTIFSITATTKITDQTKQMYEHPYQVKTAAESMRTRLAEMELYLPTLLLAEYRHKDVIIALLEERDTRQDESLAVIKERYLGDREDIEVLENALEEVRAARIRAVEQLSENLDTSELLEYIETNVNPYSEAVNQVLFKISNYADYRMEMFWDSSIQIKGYAVTGALVLSAMIIIMLIFTSLNEKKKNREIAYRDELFNLLTNNVDDVFFIYGCNDLKMEYVSGNCMRILGLSQEVFLADKMALRAYVSEESQEAFDELFRNKPIANNSKCEFKLVKDGIERIMQLQIYAIYEKNRLQRYIGVLTDLTKVVEQQKILNDALLSAQKANAAKRDFLSRMSHEIRTPMNTIIGMTTIAMRHMDDVQYMQNCLTKITYSSGHLLSLINDILDMSKIEDNKLSINYEVFDYQKQLEAITAVVYPQTVERKQKFEVVIDDSVDQMMIGDALRVNQILFNLLSNAVKFTPENGEIRLEISKRKEKNGQIYVQFVVRDTGMGMSEEYLQRLYRPFEQADTSIAQKYGGSGLGMSITKNLVSLLDGTIEVQSKEGEGTAFTVTLPFGIANQKELPAKGELDKIKVLVVDDDESTCEHAVLLMESMGVQSSWVNSGRKAIEVVLQAHEQGDDFDVCLIDWCMPDMDGVETARNIRKSLGPDTLIIIISAYDWSVIEQEAREAGVNAFISKPMFASSIFHVLHSAIKPRYGEVGAIAKEPQYNFHGKKILLAEDNEINQEIVVELLKDIDLEVTCADNGQIALEMFEQSKPDEYKLILMDVQMPVMNGYEATRAIRASKHPRAAAVPIFAMTANAFNEDVAAAREAGMDGHLAKPIDVELLYKMLAEHIK